MTQDSDFDLSRFTPYLLNIAAEVTGRAFQKTYKDRYGMLRTEWRVLFHLGRYGPLTAKDICDRANLHKTKVSRAVAALEKKRFLKRETRDNDRRNEDLILLSAGQQAYRTLSSEAEQFDHALMGQFSEKEREILQNCLRRLAAQG